MASTIHILLVDDDPLMRRLFGGKLTASGFEVVYATNGNDGREAARRLKPDLVIMDIRMPGSEDGYKTAERMKSEPQTKDIPIILLSNNDFSLDAEKLAKEVVNDYIHKSADLDEFVERVKKVLEKK